MLYSKEFYGFYIFFYNWIKAILDNGTRRGYSLKKIVESAIVTKTAIVNLVPLVETGRVAMMI